MNKNHFLMAVLLSGGIIFSACTDKTVATTDQYPEDGTTAEQYPADDTQTTTDDGTTDTGVASDTGMEEDTDTGVASGTGMEEDTDTGVATDTGMEREDVAASGEEVEMERMGGTGMEGDMMANVPAETQQLVMPLQDMMEQMNNQELSGNLDQDFAQMMIKHHQGAINLSDQVMQSGDNQEIMEWARRVSQTKQQEIEQLQSFADNQSNTGDMNTGTGMDNQQMGATGGGADQLKAATEGTMQELANAGLNGDPDHDYAHLLILHHQDAIEMAEVAVQQGQNEELKALAQQIIENNRQEISQLETWVSNNDQ